MLRAGVVVIAAHVLSVIFPVVRQSDYVADIKSEIVHIAELSFEIVLCRAGGSVVGIATLVHHIHEILFRICECHIRICREDDYSVFLDRSCTGFCESHGISHLFPFKCKFIVEFRPARCCPLYELGIRDLSAGGFGGNVVHSHLDSGTVFVARGIVGCIAPPSVFIPDYAFPGFSHFQTEEFVSCDAADK